MIIGSETPSIWSFQRAIGENGKNSLVQSFEQPGALVSHSMKGSQIRHIKIKQYGIKMPPIYQFENRPNFSPPHAFPAIEKRNISLCESFHAIKRFKIPIIVIYILSPSIVKIFPKNIEHCYPIFSNFRCGTSKIIYEF